MSIKCKSCKQEIEMGAVKCHHCGSLQNPILNKLQSVGLVLSTLVALVSLYGAYTAEQQAEEAKSANTNAKDALRKINELDGKVSGNLSELDRKIVSTKKDIDTLALNTEKASDAASDAEKMSIKLEQQQKRISEDIDNNLKELNMTLADAKSQINSLIDVSSENDKNVLDIENKVRIQWGKFKTNSEDIDKQQRIEFPSIFANDSVAIALTIVGNPSLDVEGKSVIAKDLNASGFYPMISEKVLFRKSRQVALGVEIAYVAFGNTPE
jgi:archaellum component FlaC